MSTITRFLGRHRKPRRLFISAFTAVAVVASGAAAMTVGAATASAAASTGDNISYKLEGCRFSKGLTLPDGNGNFICPDAAYSTGNLLKGWNELDLVPIRVTLDAGTSAPATQDFAFALVVDNFDAGHPGYDVLSAPVLNAGLSTGTCGGLAAGDETIANPGLGGIDKSLYRTLSVTGQASGSTCVYDAYARLALGSHLFPGSSLHFDLANTDLGTQGIGSKDVSIPVKEIAPQELSKDMTATQGSDHVWNVVKSPTPATVSFTNTCDPAGSLSAPVSIKVTWTKQPATASGPITVVTHVYATNPASRAVTVSVTDLIKSGTTLLDTANAGPIDVPANTTQLVLTHSTTVAAGTTGLNDVATASYTDKVTGIAIPGTTQATASAVVQTSGPELNTAATINDVESITGAGLAFSTDSYSGATGAFDGGYVAGTKTTGPVSWTSDAQSDSGSVTFNKTIYATSASIVTGTLSDTATLTGSDGFTTSAGASVDVSTNATTSLAVSKTTSLQLASAQTFTFHLFNGAVGTGDTTSVTIPALSTGPVTSTAISGLDPGGSYSFAEDATAPYPAQTTGTRTFTLVPGDPTSCSATIPVTNTALPATARVKKDTVPASSGNWTMTLTGPAGLTETLSNVQAGAGYAAFASGLSVDGGNYTITETQQAGYDLTGVTGDLGGVSARVTKDTTARSCSFTLNLVTDSGKVFSCGFTNTKRGKIIVKKITSPDSPQTFSFTPSYEAPFTLQNGGSDTSALLVPGSYSVSEGATLGWDNTSATCDGTGNTPANITLLPGATVTCTFINTQRGAIIVKKVTDPSGATATFGFSGDASGTIGDGGTIVVGNIVPGTYTSTEASKAGWDLTSVSCDDASSATVSSGSVSTRTATFKVDPGETVTCTFTNRERGHANLVKTVNGQPPSGSQAFTFQLRSGSSPTTVGTILESQIANAANGGNVSFSTDLVPGTTYQFCEIVMPGWLTSLGTFVPNSFNPPDGVTPNPNVDNSILCGNFTVTAGQTKTFMVDNTPPPGGRALTIGFWKNWNTCASSNGNQKPVLDQVLGSFPIASGQTTHGVYIGIEYVDTCQEAVALLNKSSYPGGKKMASDPLFNMAAQLMAAVLNFQAGAGKCPSATTAVNSAQALLVKYHFDGNGYSPKLTSADATLANSLATTLDNYNNNRLC